VLNEKDKIINYIDSIDFDVVSDNDGNFDTINKEREN